MKLFFQEDTLEVGLDEVARGCLFGRVYAAAVVWPPNEELSQPINKDSKRYTRLQRERLFDYIRENAIDYGIGYVEVEEIDNTNIQVSSFQAMHNALQQLSLHPDLLLVDGNRFEPYRTQTGDLILHQCIVGGDNEYCAIACASILAKVAHDRYIQQLCQDYPDLESRYHLLSNMGYGSAVHRKGITTHGITQFHRRSYRTCQNMPLFPVTLSPSIPRQDHKQKKQTKRKQGTTHLDESSGGNTQI